MKTVKLFLCLSLIFSMVLVLGACRDDKSPECGIDDLPLVDDEIDDLPDPGGVFYITTRATVIDIVSDNTLLVEVIPQPMPWQRRNTENENRVRDERWLWVGDIVKVTFCEEHRDNVGVIDIIDNMVDSGTTIEFKRWSDDLRHRVNFDTEPFEVSAIELVVFDEYGETVVVDE